MATKKALVGRWLEEPGRTIASRLLQIVVDYGELLRQLEQKAVISAGGFRIPKEWLPQFDTKSIFDQLNDLPYRDEISNGRDLRGIPSFAGWDEWDLTATDFCFLPNTGHRFWRCRLDGSIFDGSNGDFEFFCPLRKVRFRGVRCRPARFRGGFFASDCIECDFSSARMKKASFSEGSNLSGSLFVETDLAWANLTGCDLRGCVFRGATLANAAIQEAIIDKTTDFRGANLVGLSWSDRLDNSGKVFKRGSDWRRATYDSATAHD